jgi:hypothetical protein
VRGKLLLFLADIGHMTISQVNNSHKNTGSQEGGHTHTAPAAVSAAPGAAVNSTGENTFLEIAIGMFNHFILSNLSLTKKSIRRGEDEGEEEEEEGEAVSEEERIEVIKSTTELMKQLKDVQQRLTQASSSSSLLPLEVAQEKEGKKRKSPAVVTPVESTGE